MFCHIIGYPLKNPRSVKIWSNFFKKKKLNIKMSPLEVRPKFFHKSILKLKKNKNFLGCAITMPFKEKAKKYISYGNKLSEFSKSINLIVKNKSGKCFGYNTDIEGALGTIKSVKIKNKIIIFGFGGTGKPLFNVLFRKYKNKDFLIISKKKLLKLKKIKNVKVKKKLKIEELKTTDLFINCSPLGSNLKKSFLKKSPLSENHIRTANKKITIFDIIYSPINTRLSNMCKKNNIKYLNGITMNTIQAKKALTYILKTKNY